MKRCCDDLLLHGHGGEGQEVEEHGHRSPACLDDAAFFLSLSCGGSSSSSSSEEAAAAGAASPPRNKQRRRRGRELFACRTCGRQFATFQALGGHRTSHLRRPAATKHHHRPKPVAAHACGTCGLGFSTGQALGGHMRRHRRPNSCIDSDDVDLTQIIVHERPCSSSLQLLDLFV
ncbi:zinc finger protein ZAT11-like [Panicum miliaceum]|uniref:Zinc finger protein ZAT11-like n=1 Tax=Panicum miliaceum TaxID=4540 RepID=A0A3L6Q4K8_PANMI|nr:zinc finger protein ZAT11-like [Panicum miliaceum]